MRTVVDASAVVPYLLGGATAEERARMLGAAHAPALIDVEVAHTARGFVRGGKLELDGAEALLEDLGALGVTRWADRSLLRRAWELRDRCTIYDGLYVALAEALDVPFMTRDARLARGVAGLVEVVGP